MFILIYMCSTTFQIVYLSVFAHDNTNWRTLKYYFKLLFNMLTLILGHCNQNQRGDQRTKNSGQKRAKSTPKNANKASMENFNFPSCTGGIRGYFLLFRGFVDLLTVEVAWFALAQVPLSTNCQRLALNSYGTISVTRPMPFVRPSRKSRRAPGLTYSGKRMNRKTTLALSLFILMLEIGWIFSMTAVWRMFPTCTVARKPFWISVGWYSKFTEACKGNIEPFLCSL